MCSFGFVCIFYFGLDPLSTIACVRLSGGFPEDRFASSTTHGITMGFQIAFGFKHRPRDVLVASSRNVFSVTVTSVFIFSPSDFSSFLLVFHGTPATIFDVLFCPSFGFWFSSCCSGFPNAPFVADYQIPRGRLCAQKHAIVPQARQFT